MFAEYLAKKTLDVTFAAIREKAKKVLNEKDAKFPTTRTDIEESLTLHFRSIKNWAEEISFSDLKKTKLTTDVYIELDIFVYPRHIRITRTETIETISLQRLFDVSSKNIVLLGQPGAGKTTSMKFLCNLLLNDEDFQKDRFHFPILIKLRDLNNEKLKVNTSFLAEHIFRILGLKLLLPGELQGDDAHVTSERRVLIEKLVISLLEEFKVLLVLDGFDEIGKSAIRDKVISEINRLAPHLEMSAFILTSRTGDFKYSIDNSEQYEIAPLSREQITNFATRWLNDSKKAEDFIAKVYKTPIADTAIRPLTLAHLCAIYERVLDIPEKPKTVYKKIVNLLLEEWDQQRHIKRDSRYAHFEVDRKYEFLCHLAFTLTSKMQTSVFSTSDLLNAYEKIYDGYGLNSREGRIIISEIETHNGLFIQSGFDEFEFAHKSLQEFLTAEYLVKLPSIPSAWWTLMYLPNELAIAVAISSDPSMYFAELISARLSKRRLPEDFIRPFLNRLIIEKPDFKTTIYFQLALLTACSYYIESYVLVHDNITGRYTDQTLKDLEKLIKFYYTKDIAEILNSYNTTHIYERKDGDPFIRLTIDKSKFNKRYFYDEDEGGDIDNYLPEKIVLRNSILLYKSRGKAKP